MSLGITNSALSIEHAQELIDATTEHPAYGQFWSNETQIAYSNTEVYPLTFTNINGNHLVTKGTGVSNSHIIISKTGPYNLQFSIQTPPDSPSGTIDIWFKKNGENIPGTAGRFNVDNKTESIIAWNTLVEVTTPGDTFELVWNCSLDYKEFPYYPASGPRPEIPSVILTVVPVGT